MKNLDCSSSRLFELFSKVEFTIEQEIDAVDKQALCWLMDAGKRGFIAAYQGHLVNLRPGGRSQAGDNNAFFGCTHDEDTRSLMKAAWTPTRRALAAERLKRVASWKKLTDAEVLAIRLSPASNKHLAEVYNVHQASIIRIRKHETYDYVGGPAYVSRCYKHGKYAKSLKNKKESPK